MTSAPPLVCPCCGQLWYSSRDADAARAIAAQVIAGPIQGRIVARLLKRFGEFVPRCDLVSAAYAGSINGGPDNAGNVVAKHVNTLRGKLQPHGLVIDGKTWFGSRLRWAESPAESPAVPAQQSANR